MLPLLAKCTFAPALDLRRLALDPGLSKSHGYMLSESVTA